MTNFLNNALVIEFIVKARERSQILSSDFTPNKGDVLLEGSSTPLNTIMPEWIFYNNDGGNSIAKQSGRRKMQDAAYCLFVPALIMVRVIERVICCQRSTRSPVCIICM